MSISEKVGKYAYCPSHVNFFKNRKQWYDRGKVVPVAGDVIFFQSGGEACHVGLVRYVSGSTVYTVEGNTSGASGLIDNGGGVCGKNYPLSSSYIMGYGRPAYGAGEAAKLMEVAVSQIGYLEKRSSSSLDDKTANAGYNNYNKYARDIWPSLQAQPWCDIFVSWCAVYADKNVATGVFSSAKTLVHYYPFRAYQNGSTEEPVYEDSDFGKKYGSLNPWESCWCMGRYGNAYAVLYQVDGYADRWKMGYVKYSGGVAD